MLFVPAAVAKQDQLHTLTRAASATPTHGNSTSRRFFFSSVAESGDSSHNNSSSHNAINSSSHNNKEGNQNNLSPHSETNVITGIESDSHNTEQNPPAEVSAYAVVHQGMLFRLTSWGQWKERYFVMDRVGIYWYRSSDAMQVAREQLMGGQANSLFALRQLGLQVAWVGALRLARDPGSKLQMSLNSPTKIMKLRAFSTESMEAWLSAFETLRQSLLSELKAAPEVQKELLRAQSQGSVHRQHSRSQSGSNFLGQSMMVAGNTAIVRTRAVSALAPSRSQRGKPIGATFMIGDAHGMGTLENQTAHTTTSIQRESVAAESVNFSGDRYLLEGRPDSSVSANYSPLDGEL